MPHGGWLQLGLCGPCTAVHHAPVPQKPTSSTFTLTCYVCAQALCALGEASGLQVFEAAYMLGTQIKPDAQHFIAPQVSRASLAARLLPCIASACAGWQGDAC